MKITKHTAPASIMFEATPSAEITAITPRPALHWTGSNPEFYINFKLPNGERSQITCTDEGDRTSSDHLNVGSRIIERSSFRLTANTDPATVMFEGHPDITIVRISERPRESWNGKMAEFYVSSRLDGVQQAGVAYHEDGTFSKGMTAKHRQRVVPRPAIDWHKPVFTSYLRDGVPMEVRVKALVTPIDPAEAPYVELQFRKEGEDKWGTSCRYGLDGKSISYSGSSHSGKLSNVDQRERVVGEVTNSGVGVNVTYRGDVPIKVELP